MELLYGDLAVGFERDALLVEAHVFENDPNMRDVSDGHRESNELRMSSGVGDLALAFGLGADGVAEHADVDASGRSPCIHACTVVRVDSDGDRVVDVRAVVLLEDQAAIAGGVEVDQNPLKSTPVDFSWVLGESSQ